MRKIWGSKGLGNAQAWQPIGMASSLSSKHCSSVFLWGVSVTFCVLEPGYLALGLCLNASQLYAISRKLNFLYLGLLLCTMEIINNCIDFKVVAGIEGVNASKGLGTMPGTR